MPNSFLRTELIAARRQTDSLFGVISPRALYERPVAERHRMIFYLGHLDAFDWNLLARRAMSQPAFHATFDRLFERGIDPPPGQEPVDSPADWPAQPEIERYNARTREWIDSHLDDFDPVTLQMVIEHRLMHAETLAYLIHNLPFCEKSGAPPDYPMRPAPANTMTSVSEGSAALGQRPDAFGWDNEYPAHEVYVPEFGIQRYKVSNAEYLDFVHDSPETAGVPNFWVREGNQWLWRGMFGSLPLPLAWPVWVTWRQANAYAAWRGLQLPSEAQWHRAAEFCAPDGLRDNFDFNRWDPVPVDAAACAGGHPTQMTGNGWEWTCDLFAPFDGFASHPFYPGYSSDFFDAQHYVLKGASPRTAKLLARPGFRNWFRPEYPYMYAGFRLVSMNPTVEK